MIETVVASDVWERAIPRIQANLSGQTFDTWFRSLTALESVRGFYAIGSTRIKLLDVLLVLALAGSIGGCLVHMTIRRMFKGMRERLAAEAAAKAAGSTTESPARDADAT